MPYDRESFIELVFEQKWDDMMNVSATQSSAQPILQTPTNAQRGTETSQSSFQSVLQSMIEMIELEEANVTQMIGSGLSNSDTTDSETGTAGGTVSSSTNFLSLMNLLPSLGGPTQTVSQGGNGSVPFTTSGITTSPDTAPSAGLADTFANDVDTATNKYNLPNGLLQAVIQQESGFNPNSVSRAGAMGLMQLMPDTATSLGVTNPMDPSQSIEGGAKYLRQLLNRYQNNVPLALAAYNAGPGAVEKYGGVPPYAETRNYVASILKRL